MESLELVGFLPHSLSILERRIFLETHFSECGKRYLSRFCRFCQVHRFQTKSWGKSEQENAQLWVWICKKSKPFWSSYFIFLGRLLDFRSKFKDFSFFWTLSGQNFVRPWRGKVPWSKIGDFSSFCMSNQGQNWTEWDFGFYFL